MYSSVIGKVEKAKRFTEEKGRVKFHSFVAEFKGENSNHTTEYQNGWLMCSCQFFTVRNF